MNTFKPLLYANKNCRPIAGLIALTLLCFGSVQSVAIAGANLMITPTRVVFDENMRTAQVTLINNGDESGDFRISFINQNMTADGKFEAIAEGEPGQYADSMVRYSPRQITLPPGQSQVVRLMLRKPRELESGEYRSHMLFQTLPRSSKSSIENLTKKDDNTISVEIIPIVGISIPVIIRHGKLESTLKLENAQLIPANEEIPVARISVDMRRNGNQSIYGDFRAIFTPADGSTPVVIAMANGVAVYTPNTLRRFSIPLNVPSGTALNKGSVRLIFLESGKDENSGLIAETRLPL